MLDHPIVDVALGIIFVYVMLSLVTSTVQEWIASIKGLRSKNLVAGINQLVGNDYAQKIYDHSLVKNLAKKGKLPSYISARTLSTVLLESVAKENGLKSFTVKTADHVRDVIEELPDGHPLREILNGLVYEDAPAALKDDLADWFDEGMKRVSGWYAREAKLWTIGIATVVILATNASFFRIANELWENDALRTSIAAQAQAAADQGDIEKISSDSENLEQFPIGWNGLPQGCSGWAITVLGWFMSIAAVSLGAPFWFDLLGKVANLKGAGGNQKAKVASRDGS